MTEPLWQAIITTIGVVTVGALSYLASRRARLAKEVAEEVRASISTTNSGSHLKDDIEEIKAIQRKTVESLNVVKVSLVRIEGLQDAHGRDIDRLESEVKARDAADEKRAQAASLAHTRIHARIDELSGDKRPRWRR